MGLKLITVILMLLWFGSSIFGKEIETLRQVGSSASMRRLYSTPSYDDIVTAGVISAIVLEIVIPVVIILIIIISVICICRGQKQRVVRPVFNVQNPNFPLHNNNNNTAHFNVIKDPVVHPSPNVSINLAPFTPTGPTSMSKVQQRVSPVTDNNKSGFKTTESLQYELETLLVATNNFSDANVLGNGAFGFVYKGNLTDGQEIAVKRRSNESKQGGEEFKAEIELLTKLQHRNLVQLLGFCLQKGETLLVYELMPNKSLDHFLFKDNTKREQLKWPTRFKIIKGIARGLLYLHDDSPQQTIHRDLKTANVLLDADMNPKIADFGLARICATGKTHIQTNKVAGTEGYISPEYMFHRKFSTKSDVYAFGAIVLEVVSGRQISSQSGGLAENLLAFAWRCWLAGKPMDIMDPMLNDSFSRDEVEKCIHIGLLCLNDKLDRRPNMSTIVHKLNADDSEVASLPIPEPSTFYSSINSDQSSRSSSRQSVVPSTGDANAAAWSQFKECR